MPLTIPSIVIILLLAVLYGYLNGLHGSASIIATMLSSRALGIRWALVLATVGISAGPFILGVAVANTIGAEIVQPAHTTTAVVMAALLGAILWSSFTLWLKLPSSISQALVGGLIGAVWAQSGAGAIMPGGLWKTLAGLFLSPVLGMVAGFLLVRLTYTLSANATPHINRWFNRGQILVALMMAISFGANDAQKIMGMMALGLVTTGFLSEFAVPTWVVALSAASIGLGTLMGGTRLVRTLGGKFYKIRPIHGFGAQVASSTVILGAALSGAPVSGSQVVTSAIVGAGSADRIQQIRWGVVRQILAGWVLTIPSSGMLSAVLYMFIKGIDL